MPPLTQADVFAAIRRATGDVDPATGDKVAAGTGVLSDPTLTADWALHQWRAGVDARLPALYTEREAVAHVLQVLDALVSFNAGGAMQVSQKERLDTQRAKLAAVQARIDAVEAQARANRAVATGRLATVEPVTPPAIGSPVPFGPVDANDPRYGGSPYLPTRGGL